MRKIVLISMISILMVGLVAAGCGKGEKASDRVAEFANSTIVKMGSDSIIVKAVKAANSNNKTMASINELDEKWKAEKGIADYMQKMMDSECGRHLRSIKSKAPYYGEIFVMDNKGANVAMSDKTSDFWQGDEDKFKLSFNNGNGGIHIGDAEFDESTQATLVQVSVPVKDGDTVIGALTIGIDVDKLK